jgi:hypothetical protein
MCGSRNDNKIQVITVLSGTPGVCLRVGERNILVGFAVDQ